MARQFDAYERWQMQEQNGWCTRQSEQPSNERLGDMWLLRHRTGLDDHQGKIDWHTACEALQISRERVTRPARVDQAYLSLRENLLEQPDDGQQPARMRTSAAVQMASSATLLGRH
jgi:hypothetical protein